MVFITLFFNILIVTAAFATCSQDGSCCKNFECDYNILQKLIQLEEKTSQQNNQITSLLRELKGANDKISVLNNTLILQHKSADGITYTRWGRTECPSTATLVYKGYAAGAHYTHSGTATNILCLPEDPTYQEYTAGFQSGGLIYGAEYQTSDQPNWRHLHQHDVPCAVCRIPRNNVLMVPGKNICHDNFILEYRGYLMAEHYTHTASSEFVCIDENPEVLSGGHANQNGKLFYMVQGQCGSLKCDPYKDGWELTCAVCSYVPYTNSNKLQPYN